MLPRRRGRPNENRPRGQTIAQGILDALPTSPTLTYNYTDHLLDTGRLGVELREEKIDLTPQTWHMNNIADRVREVGDLFKPVLGKGIDLDKVLRKVAALV